MAISTSSFPPIVHILGKVLNHSHGKRASQPFPVQIVPITTCTFILAAFPRVHRGNLVIIHIDRLHTILRIFDDFWCEWANNRVHSVPAGSQICLKSHVSLDVGIVEHDICPDLNASSSAVLLNDHVRLFLRGYLFV